MLSPCSSLLLAFSSARRGWRYVSRPTFERHVRIRERTGFEPRHAKSCREKLIVCNDHVRISSIFLYFYNKFLDGMEEKNILTDIFEIFEKLTQSGINVYFFPFVRLFISQLKYCPSPE